LPATGLVLEDAYLDHHLADDHPEAPARLRAIRRRLTADGLADDLIPLPAAAGLAAVDPAILRIHGAVHVAAVGSQAQDPAICRLATAGAVAAVDAVCAGQVVRAFCALRPPGHHAEDFGEYGFCFYNHVAIAAAHARTVHGLERILIVDWDYHHGNGTEWAFYADPTVLVCSTHDADAFPGTGLPGRTGTGAGRGCNLNLPLPPGAGDRELLAAFERRILPRAADFRRELVLISAGFDARAGDPLGRFTVTDDGFHRVTGLVCALADEHAGGRVVSCLEGGYDPDGLAAAVASHLTALIG
jgi:acetoin utilization deacetylase AcuC-like enzyme